MHMILHASNLHKQYGSLEVLKGIDLHVEKGKLLAVVGASGSGKSTLLQLLGTLDRPDQGEIQLNGIAIQTLNTKQLARFRNTHIGFVFQFHNLLPEFTALENAAMPAMLAGLSAKQAQEKAGKLLERFGLSQRADHKPSALSGGEQQRVAVARALINQPAIIFADEPSGNLDSKNAHALHRLFFELREEFSQTFIVVTHNMELAKMADRTLELHDGQIVR